MKRSLEIGLALIIIFVASFPLILSAQCDVTATTNNSSWNTSGTWTPNSVPISTDNVCWDANITITFPTIAGGIAQTTTIASMTMDNGDVLTIGDGTNTDKLIIAGSLSTTGNSGNNITIIVKSGATLEIDGDFVLKNHITLNVESGGTLTIGGKLDVNNNASIDVSGNVTVGGDFTIGDAGQITVNSGGSVTVGGAVTAGNASCATINGAFNFNHTTCNSGTGSNCGTSGTFCEALPITLNSLKALVINQSVSLKWSTSSERNFNYFMIERSSNGIQYSDLVHINGFGNSDSRKDYSYIDQNPFMGSSYYRLTSIDFDGYTEVFNNNVVRVNVKSEKNFSIVPNPIHAFNLKGALNFEATHGSIIIYDRMGSMIAKYPSPDSQIDLQLPALSSGVYFAQFQSGEFSKTVRFAVNQ